MQAFKILKQREREYNRQDKIHTESAVPHWHCCHIHPVHRQQRWLRVQDCRRHCNDIQDYGVHSAFCQLRISNGQEIYFRVAFKPVATLLQSQPTVNRDGEAVSVKARGRHDPCVLPRAVPIVEAMAAMVILDNYMLNNTRKC